MGYYCRIHPADIHTQANGIAQKSFRGAHIKEQRMPLGFDMQRKSVFGDQPGIPGCVLDKGDYFHLPYSF
jgi:hypothetical protein